jgi:tryptophan synthase alpha chain
MMKKFVGYLTAGDGGLDYSFDAAMALIAGGVDVLEIGIPFSEPVADGPVIQAAIQRAFNAKIGLSDVLTLLSRIREKTAIPIVLYSYYNPLLRAGKTFLQEAKKRGANSLLLVDLPFEEEIDTEGLSRFYLITPSTSEERLQKIIEKAKAGDTLYYVMQKGTTGMRAQLPPEALTKIKRIKERTSLPLVAGFGISKREDAKAVLEAADGFVVGSYFVDAMGRNVPAALLKEMAKSLDPRE